MTVIRKTKKKRTKRRKRKRKKRKNEKGETHPPPILRTTGRGWFISAFNVRTLFSMSLDQTQNMFLESCF